MVRSNSWMPLDCRLPATTRRLTARPAPGSYKCSKTRLRMWSYCAPSDQELDGMPKSYVIEPDKVFDGGTIRLQDIAVNAYQKTVEEELRSYSPEDFLNIWQDMCGIREFETILNEIKVKGVYKGIAYNHAGPAHLSIGQEAAAVGMAVSLAPEDHIFGSHRSHGEILAKGFSAIRQLSDAQLMEIITSYRAGALLHPVEKRYQATLQGLAVRFFT